MGKTNNKTEIDPQSKTEEFLSKKNLDQMFLSDDLAGGGQWDSEIKALLDNYTLKSLYFSEDWVFILLDLLCSEISDVDMKVSRETFTSDRRNVVEFLDDHPLNKLIQKPNPMQDYSTWMYLHVLEYCLMGNSIQWYAEKLNQLHIIPAESAFLDIDEKTNILKRYIVNSQHGKLEGVTFKKEQILHQRRPNPVSTYWGLSPFVPNSKALLFNRYTQDYLNSFYLKQATGQLALSLDKAVSEEAAMRLMRSFEHSYTGRRNQRRTMLLPKGVSVTEISQSIADQNLLEIVNQNREKIINILRVPKHALSLAEAGSLGSEEHKTALKFMWTSAIKPIMKKISGTFTDFFQEKGMLASDEKFAFDLSHIELLREDSIRTADLAIRQLEFKTLNEVRRDLYDLPPLPGGDENPRAHLVEEEELEEEEIIENSSDILETKGEIAITKLMTRYGQWYLKSQEELEKEIKKTEQDMHRSCLNLFVDMASKAVRDFRSTYKDKKCYGSQNTKAASGSKNALIEKLIVNFDLLADDFIEQAEQNLLPASEAGYIANLESILNDNIRERVAELGERDEAKRKAALRSRIEDAFKSITETSINQVIETVEKAVLSGKTISDTSLAIVAMFATKGPARADLIARTESYTSLSLGKKAALDNAVEIVPNMVKVWINEGDDRVRGNPDGKYPKTQADHWKLQGEIRPAKDSKGEDTKFSNGLRFPRDPDSNKAAEKVNCRCDFMMVAPEDLDKLQIARP